MITVFYGIGKIDLHQAIFRNPKKKYWYDSQCLMLMYVTIEVVRQFSDCLGWFQ